MRHAEASFSNPCGKHPRPARAIGAWWHPPQRPRTRRACELLPRQGHALQRRNSSPNACLRLNQLLAFLPPRPLPELWEWPRWEKGKELIEAQTRIRAGVPSLKSMPLARQKLTGSSCSGALGRMPPGADSPSWPWVFSTRVGKGGFCVPHQASPQRGPRWEGVSRIGHPCKAARQRAH